MNKKNNFQFVIQATDQNQQSNQRLDKWLSQLEELKHLVPTRSYAQNLIEKGFVRVNHKITKGSHSLKINDVVDIEIPESVATELLPYDLKLDIVFEDSDVLVVNKPAGLVVHPSAGHEQDTLVNALLHHTKQLSMKNEQRPGIVHRIDKDTSGLLVVAKNDLAHENLASQFKNKTTHRIYYAITDGKLVKLSGTAQSYLARHPVDRKRFASLKKNGKVLSQFTEELEHAKWAVTHFKHIESTADKHLWQLQLETGRTHQIRVHMSELGHALIGDTLYGYSVKKMQQLSIDRFYLHAAELGFTHPKTKEKMLFQVSWPKTGLEKIRQWGFRFYEK